MRSLVLLFVCCLAAGAETTSKTFHMPFEGSTGAVYKTPVVAPQASKTFRMPFGKLAGAIFRPSAVIASLPDHATTCAIPLLQVVPPGKPVPMPNFKPSGNFDQKMVIEPPPPCKR